MTRRCIDPCRISRTCRRILGIEVGGRNIIRVRDLLPGSISRRRCRCLGLIYDDGSCAFTIIITIVRTTQGKAQRPGNRKSTIGHRIRIGSGSIIRMAVPGARISSVICPVAVTIVVTVSYGVHVSGAIVSIVGCTAAVVVKSIVVEVVPVMIIRVQRMIAAVVWIEWMVSIHWIVRVERMIASLSATTEGRVAAGGPHRTGSSAINSVHRVAGVATAAKVTA